MSYLNTKPLTYGFERGMMKDKMDLLFEYPSRVANLLINDGADIGLIPVAVIPELKTHHIISDYCIGASEEVASVCLFSEVPIEEIKTIWLDYQSRTSVALLKILLARFWKIKPEFRQAMPGYENDIAGDVAGLVIGDRALVQRAKNKYVYDLAGAWQQMTGLPFVFAAWVANKDLPAAFSTEFNMATGLGLQHVEEIVDDIDFPAYDLQHYYTRNIDYRLDAAKKEGMALFLKYLSSDQ